MRTTADRPGGRELAVLWLVALVVAVPAVVFALRAVRSIEVPSSQAFHEYNAARVDEFAARLDEGARGVVMFGDSRLRYGTELQDSLSLRLTGEVGENVAVLRIVNDWAILEDFESLVPDIIDAGPELVLVQEELRERNRGRDAGELLQREYLWWKVLGDDTWNPGDRPQDYLQQDTSCEVNESLEARAERVAQWVDFDPDGPARSTLADFVDRVEAADIDLHFLHVPVTTAAANGLPGVHPTEAPLGIAPDFSISDDHYCDVVHLDADGRAIYTDWLITTIGRELDDE